MRPGATAGRSWNGRAVPNAGFAALSVSDRLVWTTPEPLTARPDDNIAAVVAEMLDARVRSMPVVDHGELVGIVSRRDVLRLVAAGELTSAAVWMRRVAPVRRDRAAVDPEPRL